MWKLWILPVLFNVAVAIMCDKKDRTYTGHVSPVVGQVETYPNNPHVPVLISGNLTILNGCQFIIKNFTFLPGMAGSAWYARNGTDTDKAMRASSAYVHQLNGQDSQTFDLVQFVGENVSWEEIDRLVLYSTLFKFEMATVDLNNVLQPSISGKAPGAYYRQSIASGAQTNIMSSCLALIVGLALMLLAL